MTRDYLAESYGIEPYSPKATRSLAGMPKPSLVNSPSWLGCQASNLSFEIQSLASYRLDDSPLLVYDPPRDSNSCYQSNSIHVRSTGVLPLTLGGSCSWGDRWDMLPLSSASQANDSSPSSSVSIFGGGGGIRTHGPVTDFGFQDRCTRPLCDLSKL